MVLVALLAADSRGATGDVSFSLRDQTVLHSTPDPMTLSLDVFVQVENLTQIPATAWGLVVDITPGAGTVGTVLFNPVSIVAGAPNLLPATESPFVDFDRDFFGKSYGVVSNGGRQLRANGLYVQPTNGPAPPLDATGNLTLPAGHGLVALPIRISADAAGDFVVAIRNDPIVTGVTFVTPGGMAIHPSGAHRAATLRVERSPTRDADFDDNGLYNCADIDALTNAVAMTGDLSRFDLNSDGVLSLMDVDAWRLEAGVANIQRAYQSGDANLDGFVDGSDFNIWNIHKSQADDFAWCHGNFNADLTIDSQDFGIWNAMRFSSAAAATVPEPVSMAVYSVLLAMFVGRRLRQGDRSSASG